jgi:hypothetical protein
MMITWLVWTDTWILSIPKIPTVSRAATWSVVHSARSRVLILRRQTNQSAPFPPKFKICYRVSHGCLLIDRFTHMTSHDIHKSTVRMTFIFIEGSLSSISSRPYRLKYPGWLFSQDPCSICFASLRNYNIHLDSGYSKLTGSIRQQGRSINMSLWRIQTLRSRSFLGISAFQQIN